MQHFYFDHNATTPVSQEVLDTLLPAMAGVYGNASSIHYQGQLAKQRLEMARRQVAALLHCDAREIVFVSGGTEANNLALFGTAEAGRHVITSSIEHPAVLHPCSELARAGVEITRVPVGLDGIVDPDDVRRSLRSNTVLVSIMHANNETGALQPIQEIARLTREAGVRLHVDGVQALGKVPVDVRSLGVDLYSISGHKVYGPKGIGALYIKKNINLRPLLFGGRQERELRAGTENVPGAMALGRAALAASQALASEQSRLTALRHRLESELLARVPDSGVNCADGPRLPNTSNIFFDGIQGEAMVISLDLRGFAVSSGSACSSGAVEPSHVLLAMGLSPERARSSVRFSLGASNTDQQVDALIQAVVESAFRLRDLSPTYSAHA
ncbi:MAG: cysteine desulfurase [Acidobacteriota bacterium]|nr:cysteine desulfurase [Acidobacteriota bacterium]